MKILAFAASLRKASLNKKLVAVVAGMLRELGAEVDFADFHEFDMPLFDGDQQSAEGLHPARWRWSGASARRTPSSSPIPSTTTRSRARSRTRSIGCRARGRCRGAGAASISCRRRRARSAEFAGCGRRAFRSRAAARWCSPTCSRCRTATRRSPTTAASSTARWPIACGSRSWDSIGWRRRWRRCAAAKPHGEARKRQQEIVRALEDETRIQPPSR